MRISKTVSITLPPDMLARATERAKLENRSMSELVREALRKYEFDKSLHALQHSASAVATRNLMTEDEVIAAVKELRDTPAAPS